MKNFLRENMMIVISIALPLLVVLFFALASFLPRLYVTAPAYDVLLSLQDRTTAKISPVRFSLVVKQERLKALVIKSDQSSYKHNPRLFRYDHLSGEVREVRIELPENIAELAEGSEIVIPGFAQTKVSDTLRAPDGYEFRGRRRGGGLMTELFGGSRNRPDVSIVKDGAVVRLRLPVSDYWYNNVRLVGWVIE